MFLDIFSSFDDFNQVFMNMNYIMWMMCLMMPMLVAQNYMISTSTLKTILFNIYMVVKTLVYSTLSHKMGSSNAIFTNLFICLVTLNVLGLIPYVFSLTSHLAVNLCLSLPLWTSIVLSSMWFNLPSFLAHLQPVGSPLPLNPFLCLIELTSLMVRPMTLAVRLTANLSTGHILMALLGSGFIGASHSIVTMIIILSIGLFYFIFEMGVCVVQSYIFTLLPTLYLDEHPAWSNS